MNTLEKMLALNPVNEGTNTQVMIFSCCESMMYLPNARMWDNNSSEQTWLEKINLESQIATDSYLLLSTSFKEWQPFFHWVTDRLYASSCWTQTQVNSSLKVNLGLCLQVSRSTS